MRFSSYVRMLARNHFQINPQRFPMTFLVGGCSVINSTLALVQKLACEQKINNTELKPPVFVVGHWRSGTTLLHELLSLDDRFCYPTTFQCFVPHHFMVSQWYLKPFIQLLLPRKRPMDNMLWGSDSPQEDEFALVSMGAPTTYYQFAFCNQPAMGRELLNLESATELQKQELRDALTYFYKAISNKNDKQLVLKSPPHTGRIGYLAKWFPGAKFIHITRHPYKIFPSTVHLWKSLSQSQGFQLPRKFDQRVSQSVMDCFERMYQGFFTQFDEVSPENIIEVKFEQLIENPFNEIWRIYDAFGFEGYEELQPKIEGYLASRKDYRPNKMVLSNLEKAEIDRRWSNYIQRYDYEMVPV